MTCIVGLAEGGSVYLGGDSAGLSGWDLNHMRQPKVFRNGPVVIGYTSSFRMGQLLQFALKVPDQPEGIGDFAFMVTHFVDAMRECFRTGGYLKKNSEQEEGGNFLVGYRGVLYELYSDMQVAEYRDGYAACGCGEAFARGCFYATEGHDPQVRVQLALAAAEHMSGGVRGPMSYVILPPNTTAAVKPPLAQPMPLTGFLPTYPPPRVVPILPEEPQTVA